jgi:hypothetical protein
MFAVFGEKGEPLDALSMIMKQPISAEIAEKPPFLRPAKGWYTQHNREFRGGGRYSRRDGNAEGLAKAELCGGGAEEAGASAGIGTLLRL